MRLRGQARQTDVACISSLHSKMSGFGLSPSTGTGEQKGVSPMICPNEHGTMNLVSRTAENTFRGMEVVGNTKDPWSKF